MLIYSLSASGSDAATCGLDTCGLDTYGLLIVNTREARGPGPQYFAKRGP